MITQSELEPTISHVVLNKISSAWGDPVRVLDEEDSEVSDCSGFLLADRRF